MTGLSTTLRVSACLSLLAIIGGCEQFEISDRTMKINDAVQSADTRQVLVNIVRASKQYPLIFTATSQIVSSGIADGSSVGLTIPFGPKNGNVYSASPSFKMQEGLSVTTAPLDTQEFEEGFMQPIAISTVGYYFANGWTPQILLHAFVQEIDVSTRLVNSIKYAVNGEPVCPLGYTGETKCILVPNLDLYTTQNNATCPDLFALTTQATAPTATDSDTRITKLVNSPSNPCRFAAFQYFIALLEAEDVHVAKAPQAPSSNTAVSVPTDNKGINITVNTGSTDAGKDTTSFAIDNVLGDICSTTAPVPAVAAPGGGKKAAKPAAAQPIVPPALQSQEMLFAPRLAPVKTDAAGHATALPTSSLCDDPGNTRFIIRAPEGVIYYFGTLTRLSTNGVKVIVRNSDHRDNLTLFDPMKAKGSEPRDAVVSATVDDDTYYVPKKTSGAQDTDQTMHMITLVEQIVALQKKGSSLPTVPTVQLIGQ